MDNVMNEHDYLEQKQMHRGMWSAKHFKEVYGEEPLPPVNSKEEAAERLMGDLNRILATTKEWLSFDEFRRRNPRH
ncbi:hypothetical protein G6R29_00085 [Fructobacillus sp. M2-14]|uniref:Uncharacterized protein n=1 Tax=Fructobacillus broussonetiae TaxID=2713173 RepID=A0ABS5QY50_9LACO|nr:hypothetical protein [Fructobacillus broussonetiae]MBS9338036.1 hypothetical protein [Fructobacillus broussonetiae]